MADYQNKQAVELDNATKALQELTHSISHDVRSHIRRINNFSQLLKIETQSGLSSKAEFYLSAISDNCNTLNQSIEAIVACSKIKSAVINYNKFDLTPVIENVQQKLTQTYPTQKIKITTNPLLPTIYGSRDLFTSLLFHILDNAIKFSTNREKTIIEIDGYQNANRTTLLIKDNGIGIEKSYWESIFKPFYKLHTTEEYQGIGMGLTIARAIIEKHNGQIRIESEIVKGTMVNIVFPNN